MPLCSLLYISCSRIAPEDAADEVRAIVDGSLVHNPRMGLTGALLFTGTHFVQALEGKGDAIDGLMERVTRDKRHDQLMVVNRSPIAERRFANWNMAYFGPSLFVSRHVTRLLNAPSAQEQLRAADWLAELMREFTAD